MIAGRLPRGRHAISEHRTDKSLQQRDLFVRQVRFAQALAEGGNQSEGLLFALSGPRCIEQFIKSEHGVLRTVEL